MGEVRPKEGKHGSIQQIHEEVKLTLFNAHPTLPNAAVNVVSVEAVGVEVAVVGATAGQEVGDGD